MDTLLVIWNLVFPWLPYIAIVVAVFLGFVMGLSKNGVSAWKQTCDFIYKFALFVRDAWSEKPGTPSSKRLQNGYAYIILIPVLAYALFHMIKFYPSQAYPYFLSILGFIATMFGLQLSGKTNENKNGNGTPKPGTTTDIPPAGAL